MQPDSSTLNVHAPLELRGASEQVNDERLRAVINTALQTENCRWASIDWRA